MGCGKNQDLSHSVGKADLIYINVVDPIPSKKNLASCLADISYTVLETNDNSLIVEPAEAFHIKERFYIVDGKTSSVKVFNNAGKYLFDVGRIGKGPGEFLNISDARLSSDKKRLLLFSNNSRGIYEYDLDGKFLRKTTLNFFASHFCLLSDNEMAFYTNYNVSLDSGPYNLLVTNSQGDINEKYFYFGKHEIPSFAFTGFLRSSKTSRLYANAFSDTVFEIKKGKISPKYIYDFGRSRIPLKAMADYAYKGAPNISYLGNQVLETNEAVFFDYFYKKRKRFGIYKKTTNEVLTGDALEPDYLSSIFFTPIGVSEDNGKLISLLYAGRILYHMESDAHFINDVQRKDIHLYNLIKDLDEIENPILMTFNIK